MYHHHASIRVLSPTHTYETEEKKNSLSKSGYAMDIKNVASLYGFFLAFCVEIKADPFVDCRFFLKDSGWMVHVDDM